MEKPGKLDFTLIKKGFLSATLPDGRKLTLLQPKWGLIKKLYALQKLDEEEQVMEMGDIMSAALSCNREKVLITSEDIDKTFDSQDIQHFMENYVEFVKLANSKN